MYLAAGAQAFDNNHRAAYCIPSKRPLVGSEAVRQSVHEREDAYPDAQDYADLPQRGVSLFLIWQGSFATQLGSNQLMTLSGPGWQVVSVGLQAPFRQRVDQTDLTCGARTAQDPPQTRFGTIPSLFGHELPVVRR